MKLIKTNRMCKREADDMMMRSKRRLKNMSKMKLIRRMQGRQEKLAFEKFIFFGI